MQIMLLFIGIFVIFFHYHIIKFHIFHVMACCQIKSWHVFIINFHSGFGAFVRSFRPSGPAAAKCQPQHRPGAPSGDFAGPILLPDHSNCPFYVTDLATGPRNYPLHVTNPATGPRNSPFYVTNAASGEVNSC